MIFDYTERVEKLRMGKAPSKFVLDVTNLRSPVNLSDPLLRRRMSQTRSF